jgi:hypothetical protein
MHGLYESSQAITDAAAKAGRPVTAAEQAVIDANTAQMRATYDRVWAGVMGTGTNGTVGAASGTAIGASAGGDP